MVLNLVVLLQKPVQSHFGITLRKSGQENFSLFVDHIYIFIRHNLISRKKLLCQSSHSVLIMVKEFLICWE